MPPVQLLLFQSNNPFRERFQGGDFAETPEGPGLYWMTDRDGNLLYIGKAKNLKRRLKSSRATDFDAKTSKIQRLLAKAHRIHWMKLETEEAALIEESKRIREFSPPCNTVGVQRSQKLWLGIEPDGISGLAISHHFEIQTGRSSELLLGPRLSVAQGLLLHSALVRRIWAAAHESVDFPPQLTRKVSARRHVIHFQSSESRDRHLDSLYAFLIGLTSLPDSVLPIDEPTPFQQLLWRNDEMRLAEFFRRQRREWESVALGPEAF